MRIEVFVALFGFKGWGKLALTHSNHYFASGFSVLLLISAKASMLKHLRTFNL